MEHDAGSGLDGAAPSVRPKRDTDTRGTEGTGAHVAAADVAMNFPIAGSNQVACLVKVYDQFIDHFKIGEVLDVIGVLALDDNYFPRYGALCRDRTERL